MVRAGSQLQVSISNHISNDEQLANRAVLIMVSLEYLLPSPART